MCMNLSLRLNLIPLAFQLQGEHYVHKERRTDAPVVHQSSILVCILNVQSLANSSQSFLVTLTLTETPKLTLN